MEIFSSYSGSDFLVFYAVMLVTCIVLGFWIPANLRTKGRPGEAKGLEEVAVLSGGYSRLTSAVLAQLFAKGSLEDAGKNQLRVNQIEFKGSEAEQVVMSQPGDFKTAEAAQSLHAQAQAVERELVSRGLLMDRTEHARLRVLSTLPYAVLLAIGLYRQQAGSALGETTGFLMLLLGLTAILAFMRIAKLNPRTQAGNDVLRDIELERSRLRRAPQANEAGFAVALFGTGVLVGTPWEPVHAARLAGDGAGGGFAGDSDSDSGCGGGGCGGCGG